MGSKCEKHYCDKKIPSITFPSWMSFLNNDLELKDLTIPGTHESCALHGIFFAINQTWSLENQLNAGIRFFDLRMRLYYILVLLFYLIFYLYFLFELTLK